VLKIASVSVAPPQTPLGELRPTTLPRPPSREGLLAFGNRSFAPSALNPPLAPPNKNTRSVSPPKHKILEQPLCRSSGFLFVIWLPVCHCHKFLRVFLWKAKCGLASTSGFGCRDKFGSYLASGLNQSKSLTPYNNDVMLEGGWVPSKHDKT